ncbi:hypothetical protein [Symbiopectobacterium purcellii]
MGHFVAFRLGMGRLTYKKNSTSSESRRKRPAGISTKKTTV